MARPAPAVTRALQIIDLLVAHPDDHFTISDIVRRTGISLGSAHAVLNELTASGYLYRHPAHKAYSLGPALVTAGVAALKQHPAIAVATKAIEHLAADLCADVVVTAPTPTEIIFIAVANTHSQFGPGFREGERVPLVPPFGAVFMAWAPPEHVSDWLAHSPMPEAIDGRRAASMLAAVRTNGYAISLASTTQRALGDAVLALTDDPRQTRLRTSLGALIAAVGREDEYELTAVDPERTYDISTIAAPIFDSDRRVLAAIAAAGFPLGLAAAEVVDCARRVRACATLVTKQTKGRLPT